MNRVNELRKKYGFSQKKLANMINVHQTAISQWETGRTNPDFEVATKLCKIFGVSLEYLMCQDIADDSEPSSPNSELYNLINQMDSDQLAELENYVDFILSKKKK